MWKDMKQQKYDIEDTNRYLSLKNNAIRGESNKKQEVISLLNYIWSKFEIKNGGNVRESFRFMDINGNSKVTREEFEKGLNRLMVNMSEDDLNRVFNHLDKRDAGFLTYNEFCGILTDKYKKQTPS